MALGEGNEGKSQPCWFGTVKKPLARPKLGLWSAVGRDGWGRRRLAAEGGEAKLEAGAGSA